ncbi:MAG: YtxH domain-containing protein [Chitinophagaceae bacterium]
MKRGFTIGLIVAAAAGVLAGLLFAPEKGKDLRKKIRDKGDSWGDKMKETLKSNREQLRSMSDEFSEG